MGKLLEDVEGLLILFAALFFFFLSLTAIDRDKKKEEEDGKKQGEGGKGDWKSYKSHPNPRLSQVNQQTILPPSLGGRHLLHGQVVPVEHKVALHHQRHTLQAPLMPSQHRQGLLAAPLPREDGPRRRQAGRVLHLPVRHHEALDRLHGARGLAGPVLGQRVEGPELRLLLVLGGREDGPGLAERELGPELEDRGRQGVFGGEGRGVEGDALGVLALVEVGVEGEEFAFGGEGVHSGSQGEWGVLGFVS